MADTRAELHESGG